MIGWLQGMLIERSAPGKLVVDVSGVGYDVETSLSTWFSLEHTTDRIGLHIHTVVREDALLLFGFSSQEERALFRALIKVNGVGPKLAMSILSSISPQEFVECIRLQNTAMLVRLPGVGKKTAERLVVEMRDSLKTGTVDSGLAMGLMSTAASQQDEAISALEALGYRPQEAAKAVKALDDGQKNSEQLIRAALQRLSGR
ncbi:Holliday junction DNA helicase RuvA [Legionella geestiana]|uniref:Holliday junction branch migration complex subunit RuvA n=1 Tax=Legionella geestiana TaxID=45065 RepID=A0A0W0TZD6_9GAMM|nr:Holliday junction branch migration protein RuvA [Legionella geestiana]KTD00742.1 Holliday junction DNA helicase RuvA [Legionella geestiana]QBS11598.1 Holliday junction branch migration protein RuvA [Legionella geestiana]QDQ40793.1 Holliday junction branch migration protein RuvA [Legionella geestiana]STX53723.1 Holliday junction ATP-dependent DNA helicase RuvA [Legionella geestiana]